MLAINDAIRTHSPLQSNPTNISTNLSLIYREWASELELDRSRWTQENSSETKKLTWRQWMFFCIPEWYTLPPLKHLSRRIWTTTCQLLQRSTVIAPQPLLLPHQISPVPHVPSVCSAYALLPPESVQPSVDVDVLRNAGVGTQWKRLLQKSWASPLSLSPSMRLLLPNARVMVTFRYVQQVARLVYGRSSWGRVVLQAVPWTEVRTEGCRLWTRRRLPNYRFWREVRRSQRNVRTITSPKFRSAPRTHP